MEGKFPISRDPPEGGTAVLHDSMPLSWLLFPISRDPPEGGTSIIYKECLMKALFPISRDPPEGGTP